MITKLNYQRRLALLKNGLKVNALDSILITNQANVTYMSGFPGHDSMVLITPDKNFFITDSRYIEEAEKTLDGFQVKLVEISTYDTVSDIVKKHRLKKIGFEAMDLPYGVAVRLYKLIKNAKLAPCKDMVESIRSIKDSDEIALIRESVSLNKKVFDVVADRVKPGISEKALAVIVESTFINEGARSAFEPIIASGENASKPHAVPDCVSIKNNSFVMVDIGAKLNGYCSDLTRMITLGRVKDKFKKMYAIVKTAQDKAIEMIRPGVKIRDIDAAGRDHIKGEGFGKYFGHSLGHGIGLSVHEKPTISSIGEGLIAPGMVFTVEPAIYIPGFGGVRIEDMVLVTNKGCEVLTR
ncbi:MAG: Xaa-Pro peptidase family protein [Candidatus Omnitrophica bacterium]|nr:Xaa-Pro peptidase family protein [Candidatus Omnitrophota bacterium]